MKKFTSIFGFLFAVVGIAATQQSQLPSDFPKALILSEAEQTRIDAFVTKFYDPNLSMEERYQHMMAPSASYDLEGKKVDFDSELLLKDLKLSKEQNANLADHPMLSQAQKKLTPEYQKFICEKFLKKHGIDCESDLEVLRKRVVQKGVMDRLEKRKGDRAFNRGNDTVNKLTRGYINTEALITTLEHLPTYGEVDFGYSNDYWSIRQGVTSYRYSWPGQANQKNWDWNQLQSAYSQPGRNTRAGKRRLEWNAIKGLSNLDKLIRPWSPSEKYDLLVGDVNDNDSFTLTRHQKNVGRDYYRPDKDVENWMGICHGWAGISLMASAPMLPVPAVGALGAQMIWYPDDVAAIGSLAWAEQSVRTNFVGGRCNVNDARTLPNGRIAQQECWDNAPNTFALVMGNLLPRGYSFVMDKTWKRQVWNQGVKAFAIEYFNVKNPKVRSFKFKEDRDKLLVDYKRNFKGTRADRFSSNPRYATRGRYIPGRDRYDDSEVDAIVGAAMHVLYLAETSPRAGVPTYPAKLLRMSMTADLELKRVLKRGKVEHEAVGGEWHQNESPDFLWASYPGVVPVSRQYDVPGLQVDLKRRPSQDLTRAARNASKANYPLCEVVKALYNASRSKDGKGHNPMMPLYHCNPS